MKIIFGRCLTRAEKIGEVLHFEGNFRWTDRARTQTEAELHVLVEDMEGTMCDFYGEGKTWDAAADDLLANLEEALER